MLPQFGSSLLIIGPPKSIFYVRYVPIVVDESLQVPRKQVAPSESKRKPESKHVSVASESVRPVYKIPSLDGRRRKRM